MDNYVLKKIQDKETPYLVLSTNYLSPEDYLNELANSLQGNSYIGQVLFDLLIINGPKDRFYKAFFNGKSFDLKSFKKYNVPSEIEELSNDFFKTNYDVVENSTLNDFYKFLIKKGKLKSIC